MSEQSPDVSIVVPTRDRPDLLARCLDAILDMPTSASVEVLVVNDAGEAVTGRALTDPRVTVLQAHGRGPAAARNLGIAAARAPIVLFTDDDAVPQPGWIDAALGVLARHPDAVGVAGRVTTLPHARLYEHSVITLSADNFVTCNIAYRTAALRAVGGFDEAFPHAHAEDRDLGERIVALGPVPFEPTMVVDHPPVAFGLRAGIRRTRLVESDWRLFLRHPHLHVTRGSLRWGVPLSRPWGLFRSWHEHVHGPRSAVRLVTLAAGQAVLGVWFALVRWPAVAAAAGQPPRSSLTAGPVPIDVPIDVVVPSYRRPDVLPRCLAALGAQTVRPASIVVVARVDDEPTREVVRAAQATDTRIVLADVDEPGVIAALTAGVALTTAPVVAFTDDDAMPRPDWIARLQQTFADPTVAGAGGRDVVPGEEGPLTERVGRFRWWGTLTGNHHLGRGPARDVHVLKGVNMAFRVEALALPAAGVLRGSGAQVDFEVLVCDHARRRGRLVYDPAIVVDHHSAPRAEGHRHRPDRATVRDTAFNSVVAATALRRRSLPRLLGSGLLVGTHDRPGLVRAAVAVARRERQVPGRLCPATTGRVQGAVQVLTRRGPAVVEACRLRAPSARRLVVVSHPAVLAVNQETYALLAARGWDVHLVVPHRWRHEYHADAFAPVAHRGLAGRLHPTRVLLAGRPQRHLYLTRATRTLRRLHPEVVFLEQECFSVPAGQWGRAAARLGVPFGVQAAENLDRPLPLPARLIRHRVLASAAFVAARSPAAGDLVRRWGSHADIELVPHHVPAWGHAVEDGERADRPFTVGYAGRLVDEKGLDVLVDAVRTLGPTTRLLVAGDGPRREWLEHADLGGARLDLRTRTDHADMGAVYAEMDVLALPSRTTPTWAEQFGRVLVEAMSCGVPVIGSDSGEIPWVIESTDGGMVVPEGDAAVLAAALARLRDDPAAREAFARSGRESAARTFTPDAVAARFDAQLGRVLDASARPRVTLVAHAVTDSGGMERAATALVRHLHHRVRFTVVSCEIADDLLPLVEEWRRIRVPMRPIPLKFVAFFVRAGVAVRRRRGDLVHTIGAIVPNRAGIATIQFCNAAARRHATRPAAPSRRLNTGLAWWLAHQAERWCYRPGRLDRFVAVSDGIAGEVHQYFPGIPVEVVPNGVDTTRFRPDADRRAEARHELGLPDDTFVVLFVGGDWHRKGLDLAIDAVGGLARSGRRAVLWVVGGGDVGTARRRAESAGAEVHFLGRRADTERWFAGADAFVLPTTYEASPLVLLEAAASALPVVVTPVHSWFGSDAEAAGAIVVPRDVDAIAAELGGLADDPHRRAELGRRARAGAEALSWERVAAMHAQIYDSLCRPARPAQPADR